ncbi:hypothetical protein [Paenibacillus sp. PK3_47]|uniref:hypothetical protein n=1 Tax=Paenibacillus sp. PK3_47 TaxID=2072642 RepID=UPI00201D96BE|nr:hypothetical protein [Paenibacillus sp. PK3_47]
MAAVLGACSDNNSANSATETKNAANSSSAADSKDTGNNRPEYLPEDFPLRDDADITKSTSGQTDGKKSALLIFTSREKVDQLAETYKNYFRDKGLDDAGQMIDDKNIVIQGSTDKEQWSLIGGALSAQEGTTELTLTWSEL